MKRKVINFLMIIVMIFTIIPSAMAYTYDSNKVTVYVTVNDITDIDEPLNTIVRRKPLTVTNFDISQYGEEFTGIPILDSGVTYLHVLIALHEQLFGKDKVAENLKIDSSGITRIFMGRSVGSIMYKNGDYIFAIPQYVNVYNGDEINICLYDEGYNQAIASFDKSVVNVATGNTVDFNLYKHHWYPELAEPIEGAQIVNEKGVYVLDSNSNIIETDSDGDFSITFPKSGTYKLTILPTIGYYMSTGGGTWVIWWEEIEVTEEIEKQRLAFETITYKDISEIDTETAIGQAVNDIAAAEGVSHIDMVTWDNLPIFEELSGEYSQSIMNTPSGSPTIAEGIYEYETYTEQETHTELVEHREFVSGEASQKVDYTTPWVIVNVTDDFAFNNIKMQGNNVIAETLNADTQTTGKAICAAYDYDADGNELYSEMKFADYSGTIHFSFSKSHDVYRLFAWGDSMKPICNSAVHRLSDDVVRISWDFTQPIPDNVFITGSVETE